MDNTLIVIIKSPKSWVKIICACVYVFERYIIHIYFMSLRNLILLHFILQLFHPSYKKKMELFFNSLYDDLFGNFSFNSEITEVASSL